FRRDELFWLVRRHGHVDESVAEETGTADRDFAALGDFDVVVNLQRHLHAVAFAHHPRTARHLADLRAGQQYIRAFEQTARITETHREGVICFESLAESPELHDERTEHGQTDKNKGADFKFQTTFVPIH